MFGEFWIYIVAFLVVLTVLVFVHEFGHYCVARRNSVRIEVFSIGFGPELFGFTDRAQTRWKFSAVPLGGYVKMFGDANAASMPGETIPEMTPADRAVSFHHKRLGQRAAVVAAGPIANFLFAIVVLAALFVTSGHPFPPAVVGGVEPGSAADQAGILPGDRIVSVAGQPVDRFAELSMLVQGSEGEPLDITVERADETLALEADPQPVMVPTTDGGQVRIYRLGVMADTRAYGIAESIRSGVTETASITWLTLASVGEMIVGERGTEELGGPLRIAQMAGNVAQISIPALVWFTAILSINLGLINLFPIPMLDGGHLLFYAFEAVRGRPLGERAQEYGFRIGLALVLTLMIFATWNDLVQLRVVAYLKDLIS
ncbi:MAG TPA: RIP metalloprotease RseP [Alphaproteobacteria bacterium]|nr:RIP metalloprotease RseP [Alphaproteobacteria bacterium]